MGTWDVEKRRARGHVDGPVYSLSGDFLATSLSFLPILWFRSVGYPHGAWPNKQPRCMRGDGLPSLHMPHGGYWAWVVASHQKESSRRESLGRPGRPPHRACSSDLRGKAGGSIEIEDSHFNISSLFSLAILPSRVHSRGASPYNRSPQSLKQLYPHIPWSSPMRHPSYFNPSWTSRGTSGAGGTPCPSS